jgi:hypothetical protein
MPRAATKTKVVGSSRKSISKRGSYVPGPQQIRMKQKYAAGQSMARIAREEHRHPQTVAGIVKTEDQEKFKRAQTEKLYGTFTDKAMERLGWELEHSSRGGWIAFNLLKHLGIIPNPNRQQEAIQRPIIDVNAPEEEEQDRQMLEKMMAIAIQRHKVFGTVLPGMDDEENSDGGKEE